MQNQLISDLEVSCHSWKETISRGFLKASSATLKRQRQKSPGGPSDGEEMSSDISEHNTSRRKKRKERITPELHESGVHLEVQALKRQEDHRHIPPITTSQVEASTTLCDVDEESDRQKGTEQNFSTLKVSPSIHLD